jgi:hypothetical protein
VATEIDSHRVHFESQENATNAFTWTRTSPSAWTAVLHWRDAGGEARERVYRMERIDATTGSE